MICKNSSKVWGENVAYIFRGMKSANSMNSMRRWSGEVWMVKAVNGFRTSLVRLRSQRRPPSIKAGCLRVSSGQSFILLSFMTPGIKKKKVIYFEINFISLHYFRLALTLRLYNILNSGFVKYITLLLPRKWFFISHNLYWLQRTFLGNKKLKKIQNT